MRSFLKIFSVFCAKIQLMRNFLYEIYALVEILLRNDQKAGQNYALLDFLHNIWRKANTAR